MTGGLGIGTVSTTPGHVADVASPHRFDPCVIEIVRKCLPVRGCFALVTGDSGVC